LSRKSAGAYQNISAKIVSIDSISPGKTPTIDALRNEPRVLVTAMVGQDERKFLTPRKALE
jgi:signal recognition particle receptor subunit beta